MLDFKLELREDKPEALQFSDLKKPTREQLDEIWEELGLKNPN